MIQLLQNRKKVYIQWTMDIHTTDGVTFSLLELFIATKNDLVFERLPPPSIDISFKRLKKGYITHNCHTLARP